MGYREISLKLPTDYQEDELRRSIEKELGIKEFSYQIENKSLDARKKDNIHWLLRVLVLSEEITGDAPEYLPASDYSVSKQRREGGCCRKRPCRVLCSVCASEGRHSYHDHRKGHG